MAQHALIKVIKRAERERGMREVLEDAGPGLPARENSRRLAATVTGWIDESRQTRLAQHQELKRQLDWPATPGSN